MKSFILGLSLFMSVSLLDIGQGAWAYDLAGAQSAMKARNYDQVIQLLSGEIEKLNREGLFLLAKAYSAQKKHEAAIKAYNACLSLNPKDFEAKTLIGAEQLVSGKDKEALATLKEALDGNPQFVPAYKLLIRYYEKKKNKYEQRLLYEDMIAKVGESTEALTKLCELTTQDRLYDLGSKYCQKSIIRDPKIADNYVNLGIVFKETGQPEKAEDNLKKAAQDFPKSLYAQITYAQFLEEKKNYIFSFTYYKRAAEADSKSVNALLGLGNSALEIQKYGDSLSAFERACSLDRKTLPSFRRAANSLRTMRIQDWLKKFEQAIETCS